MDIQHLVDRLEDLIDEGRHVPFSKFTLIDEERALEIIDQMRISVPDQIEKASRLINQRDRLLAQANEEATRMLELAREKSEDLIRRDSITQAAQARANNILEQARREAEAIRADADQYVLDVLRELEAQLIQNLTVARNGIARVLEEREAAAVRQTPAAAPTPVAQQPSEELVEASTDTPQTASR
jgi:DNA repair exonuclease SbcCD ATPase subunit